MNAFERGLDRQNIALKLKEVLLVCGIETGKADVSLIDGSGKKICLRMVGYAACGSGKEIAEAWLRAARYHPSMSREEALYVIYEAKKAAEAAPGIGSATDLYVLDGSSAIELPEEVQVPLARIWQRRCKVFQHPVSTKELATIAEALSN